MAIYAISDLHLSLGTNKQMDVFKGWENYVSRIEKNWKIAVKDQDTVVIPGDISWGMKLQDSKADFAFLNSLPGQKYLLKGNHDYWWSTLRKLEEFVLENDFNTINFIQNNAVTIEGISICGTRGWLYEENLATLDKKILTREAARLEMSIIDAEKSKLEPVVFLHYPPMFDNKCADEIMRILKKHDIKRCYYGHIHGDAACRAHIGIFEKIRFTLVSCDFNGFCPVLVK